MVVDLNSFKSASFDASEKFNVQKKQKITIESCTKGLGEVRCDINIVKKSVYLTRDPFNNVNSRFN